jgi:16S rRNA (guanine527-N7)-methyltransferase
LIQLSGVLLDVLDEAQQLGLLGPRPLEEHVEAILPMAAWIANGARVVDLGAGGGIPGLVLAHLASGSTWVLLDRRQRSGDFLSRAVARLDLAARVEVLCADVATVAHQPEMRGSFDTAVSRGFARPAVTLECAAPLLRVGGLALSTARDDDADWPGEDGVLTRLGMVAEPNATTGVVRAARQVSPCPPKYPRRRLPTS